MKPYYEHAGITIYHGDCRQVVPSLGRFDLLLTDPPYGIGKDGQTETTGGHGGRKGYDFLGWDKERPAPWVLQMLLDAADKHIIWGGNYFADCLPPSMKWLVWDKGQRINQSTGRAAKDLGISAVLVEREERYCEIAARRLSQEVLPL